MATYMKYADQFNQRKNKRVTSEERKFTTDKDTYIEFLEVQLEKVSNAILQVNSNTEATQGLKIQVSELDEKMASVSKILKLLQSFADAQEEDNTRMYERMQALNSKLPEKSKEDQPETIDEKYEKLSAKFSEFEKKFTSVIEQKGSLWRIQSPICNIPKEREFERIMREIDARITEQLSQKIEKHFCDIQRSIEKHDVELNQFFTHEIRTLDAKTNGFITEFEDKITQSLEREPHEQAMVQLKDEIYQKLEGLFQELGNTPSTGQFEELKNNITHQYEVIERLESNSQETLAELEQKVSQIEKMVSSAEGPLLLEGNENGKLDFVALCKSVKDLSLRVKKIEEDRGGKLSGSRKSSVDLKMLEEVEKRITEKYSSQVERIGEAVGTIIQRQKEIQHSMDSFRGRISKMESTNDTFPTKENHLSGNFQSLAIHDSDGPSARSPQSDYVSQLKNHIQTVNSADGNDKSENPFLKAKYIPAEKHGTFLENKIAHYLREGTSLKPAEKIEVTQSRSPVARNAKIPGGTKVPKKLNSKKKAQPQQVQNNETKKSEALPKKAKEKGETIKARKCNTRSNSRTSSHSRGRTPNQTESSFVANKSQSPIERLKSKKLKKKVSKTISNSAIAEVKHTIGIIAAPMHSVSSQVSVADNDNMFMGRRYSSVQIDKSMDSIGGDTLKDLENRLSTERLLMENVSKSKPKKSKKKDNETPKFQVSQHYGALQPKKKGAKAANLDLNKENIDHNSYHQIKVK